MDQASGIAWYGRKPEVDRVSDAAGAALALPWYGSDPRLLDGLIANS